MIRRAVLGLVLLTTLSCGGSPTGPSGALPPSDGVPPGPPPLPAPIPSDTGPQVFVGAGDIAMCDANSEATARLLDNIGGTVYTLGDHAYFRGTRQEFRDCYDPTWGRHRSRTRPVPGNHDYESPGAAPYFEYFGLNAGPPGRGYYSFSLGAWHAIALNSNVAVGAGSAQGVWLQNELASSRTRCTIAYWHHPLFTSGPDGDSPQMRELWQTLYDAGAEIVLNGHEHFYERFAPLTPEGANDPARGIRQFIVGTGGAIPYGPVTIKPHSEVRIRGFGVLKLTLMADSYQWDFIQASGPGDSGSGACH